MGEQGTPPRFRIVLELTFPEADPWDPSDYLKFPAQLQETLNSSTRPVVADVTLREFLTIPRNVDDYTDWKRGTGQYDLSRAKPGTVGKIARRPEPLVGPDDQQ